MILWPISGCLDIRDELLDEYDKPHRAYHSTKHLENIVHHLQQMHQAGTPFALEPTLLAAWFHDSVYTGDPSDEFFSAKYAADALDGRVTDEVRYEVIRLILLTKDHNPKTGDDNGAALSDADLAVLAAPPYAYAEYMVNVRKDFSRYHIEEFTKGRIKVLEDLSNRTFLYKTHYGRTHWDKAARRNLQTERLWIRGEV